MSAPELKVGAQFVLAGSGRHVREVVALDNWFVWWTRLDGRTNGAINRAAWGRFARRPPEPVNVELESAS